MPLSSFTRAIARISLTLAATGAASLAALVAYSVFMRWALGKPPHWAEELPQLILVWTTLLAAIVCTRHRSHLNAGLLPLLVRSNRVRHLVGRVTDLLLLLMLLLLAKAGWDLAMVTMSQTTTALQIPAGIVYLAVPVSCVGMALMQLEHLFTRGETP
ncbi:TRAP transporter small permease [Halomonas sp. GXIMD04776]|uniref:TRAP transporter small permease n=1 Tax=Halomonas sp. GXIMD04776 TaxID=3415605 RepID=UPI003CB0A675